MLGLKVLVLLLFVDVCTEALRCIPCDPARCRDPEGCKGGLVPDICHCCKRCAKVLDEECGGVWDTKGICDAGLNCIRPVNAAGQVIDLDNAIGKCTAKKTGR